MMEEEERENESFLWVKITRIALSLALALLGVFYLNEDNFSLWVNALVMGTSWLIVSYDVLIECFENIFKKHEFFDECTLMVTASIGAFCLRFFGKEHNEFIEAVLIMLLWQIGEMFEDFASNRSKKAIVSALDLRKEKAKVILGDASIDKSPEEIQIGDKIAIGAGEKVLSDGVVLQGEGELDVSSLTGEFEPILVKEGMSIASGTLLKTGSIILEATKLYSDSTVAKLLSMVEEGAKQKSKATRFIRKFARIYTPLVMLLALLVAVIPPLFIDISNGATWASWIFTGLEFLVVSCPCAIVVSIPLAYFAGMGLASKNGIVIKEASSFDKAQEIKLVCFDKTGTLTKGEFKIVALSPNEVEEETFIEYLSASESRSSHPIAKAVRMAYPFSNESMLTHYEEKAGYGVMVTYKGKQIRVGKKDDESTIKEGTNIHMHIDEKYAGFATLSDVLRENSGKTIAKLKDFGIRTCLISGDRKNNVSSLASVLGIDEWHGELLPEEKLSILKEKIGEGKGMVAFVGDGINDAPSLALSDIGFAMGGLGSDAAIESADVVLMKDDPYKVVTFLQVAKKTKHRAIFNTVFTLAIKFGVMIAAVASSIMGTWSLPMWAAVLADSGLSTLMVLSSLSLFYSRIK